MIYAPKYWIYVLYNAAWKTSSELLRCAEVQKTPPGDGYQVAEVPPCTS